jgi:hypothetical protein
MARLYIQENVRAGKGANPPLDSPLLCQKSAFLASGTSPRYPHQKRSASGHLTRGRTTP